MKKKILFGFGLLMFLGILFLNISISFQNGNYEVDMLSNDANAKMTTKRARQAYCQMIGDRIGCKNDPGRSCGMDTFCN